MVTVASSNYPLSGSSIPTEGDWWRFFKNNLVSGVVDDGSYANPLQVIQVGAGNTFTVNVRAGRLICEGFFAEWGPIATLTIAGNASGSTRIDIVVAEIDFANHRADLTVVQGTPGSGAPVLTQIPTSSSPPLSGVTQVPLAVITIASGATGITTSMIQECRTFVSSSGPYVAPQIASAAALSVGALSYLTRPVDLIIPITGTTGITSIVPAIQPASGLIIPDGTIIRLWFLNTGCAVSGSVGTLTDAFTSGAVGATLTLARVLGAWYEVGRSNGQAAQRLFYATPSGGTGVPTLRAMVDADIPSTLTGKTFSSGIIVQGTITSINNSSLQFQDTGATARRAVAYDASNNLLVGTIDVPTGGTGDVKFYRRSVIGAYMGSVGSVNGVGFSVGGNAPNYPFEVNDVNNGDFIARIINASTSTSFGLIVGAGNATSGTLVRWQTGAGSTIASVTQASGTTVTYGTTSDKRFKQDIEDAKLDGIADLLRARVRKWRWTIGAEHEDFGFVAQELIKIAPEAVQRPADKDDRWGVDYGRLTPRLWAACQDIVEELESVKKQVAALEEKNGAGR